MRNLKLTIQYDGTRYKGWQRLGDTENTLQGKIEQVLSRMTGEAIEIIGSGRTDMGVHAQGQVANFKTYSTKSMAEIQQYLYQYLPEDIVVSEIEEMDERFHARYHARAKQYVYKIWNAPCHNPFLRKYVEHVPQPLNLEAMQRAVPNLLGEHDFSAFAASRSKKKSNIREIYSIDITKQESLIELTFQGNGFLHNMIRILTGTLLEVGHGRMKPAHLKDILERRDRALAGPTAAAKGLHLVKVYY